MIHAELTEREDSVYSEGVPRVTRHELPAVPGSLGIPPFCNCEIVEVNQDEIIIRRDDQSYILTPGGSVRIYTCREGDEWSDGCVYETTHYELCLTWPPKR